MLFFFFDRVLVGCSQAFERRPLLAVGPDVLASSSQMASGPAASCRLGELGTAGDAQVGCICPALASAVPDVDNELNAAVIEASQRKSSSGCSTSHFPASVAAALARPPWGGEMPHR